MDIWVWLWTGLPCKSRKCHYITMLVCDVLCLQLGLLGPFPPPPPSLPPANKFPALYYAFWHHFLSTDLVTGEPNVSFSKTVQTIPCAAQVSRLSQWVGSRIWDMTLHHWVFSFHHFETSIYFMFKGWYEICIFLGNYSAHRGNCLLMFWDNISVPYSRVEDFWLSRMKRLCCLETL